MGKAHDNMSILSHQNHELFLSRKEKDPFPSLNADYHTLEPRRQVVFLSTQSRPIDRKMAYLALLILLIALSNYYFLLLKNIKL